MKQKKRAELYGQKQYQKEGTGLELYGGTKKSKKRKSDTDLKDLSLSDITNIKPNL